MAKFNFHNLSKRQKIVGTASVAVILALLIGGGAYASHSKASAKKAEVATVTEFNDDIRAYKRSGKATVKSAETADATPSAESTAALDKGTETVANDSSKEESKTAKDSSTSKSSDSGTVAKGSRPAKSSNSSSGGSTKSNSKACKTVHHDATGHYESQASQQQTGTRTVVDQAAYDETVVDQPAWDETVVDQPETTQSVWTYYCNNCGFTTHDVAAARAHADTEWPDGYHDGFHTGYETVTVPAVTHTVHHDATYKTVHHDAVTHEEPVYQTVTNKVWVQDSAAWDEQKCN